MASSPPPSKRARIDEDGSSSHSTREDASLSPSPSSLSSPVAATIAETVEERSEAALGSIARLSGSAGAVLALMTDGSLWSGGRASSGALGLGENTLDTTMTLHRVPLPPGVEKCVDAAMGGPADFSFTHTLGLMDDGYLYSIGNGRNGQLGWADKKAVNKFEWCKAKGGLAKRGCVRSVGAGHRASVAVTVEGKVYGFGLLGENGVPSRTNVLVPKVVQLPKPASVPKNGPPIVALQANSSTHGGGFAITNAGLYLWNAHSSPSLVDHLPSDLVQAGIQTVVRGRMRSFIVSANGAVYERLHSVNAPPAAMVPFEHPVVSVALSACGTLGSVLSDGSFWRYAGGASSPTLICSPSSNQTVTIPRFTDVTEGDDSAFFLGSDNGEIWVVEEFAAAGALLLQSGWTLRQLRRA